MNSGEGIGCSTGSIGDSERIRKGRLSQLVRGPVAGRVMEPQTRRKKVVGTPSHAVVHRTRVRSGSRGKIRPRTRNRWRYHGVGMRRNPHGSTANLRSRAVIDSSTAPDRVRRRDRRRHARAVSQTLRRAARSGRVAGQQRVNWHNAHHATAARRTMKISTFFPRFFTWWNGQTFGTQLWTALYGELVGEDEFGNRYYRTKGGKIDPTLGFERRWVIYNGYAEASMIGPGLARLDASHRRRAADRGEIQPRAPGRSRTAPTRPARPPRSARPARRWRKAAARRRPATTRPGCRARGMSRAARFRPLPAVFGVLTSRSSVCGVNSPGRIAGRPDGPTQTAARSTVALLARARRRFAGRGAVRHDLRRPAAPAGRHSRQRRPPGRRRPLLFGARQQQHFDLAARAAGGAAAAGRLSAGLSAAGYPQQGYPPQQAGRPPGVQQQDLPPPPGATAAPPGQRPAAAASASRAARRARRRPRPRRRTTRS